MRSIVRWIMAVIMFAIVIFSMNGEKVALNNGAGWDGVEYREIARNFTDQIADGSYDKYRIQRVFPFALVNVTYNICGIEKTDANLMTGVQIMNFAALVLSVFFFFGIATCLNLSLPVESITFASLFYSFPVLKLVGYYPYLSDTYALLLGVAIFYFYLKKIKWGLIMTTIAGTFTWPVASVVSLIFLFLPKGNINLVSEESLSKSSQRLLTMTKTLIIIAPLLYVFAFFLYFAKFNFVKLLTFYYDATPNNILVFLLSTAALSFYFYFILRVVRFDVVKTVTSYWNICKRNIIYFFATYFLISFIVRLLSNGETGALGLFGLLQANILFATTDPFVFLVNHFMYYGFSIVLIILFWKQLLSLFSKLGVNYILVLALALFFSLRGESRVNIMFYPLLLFPLATLMNNYSFSKVISYCYILLSLLLSRFWFMINVPGIDEAFKVTEKPCFLEFPAQRYFMNFSHWQAHWVYYLFGALMICSIVVFYYIKRYLLKRY